MALLLAASSALAAATTVQAAAAPAPNSPGPTVGEPPVRALASEITVHEGSKQTILVGTDQGARNVVLTLQAPAGKLLPTRLKLYLTAFSRSDGRGDFGRRIGFPRRVKVKEAMPAPSGAPAAGVVGADPAPLPGPAPGAKSTFALRLVPRMMLRPRGPTARVVVRIGKGGSQAGTFTGHLLINDGVQQASVELGVKAREHSWRWALLWLFVGALVGGIVPPLINRFSNLKGLQRRADRINDALHAIETDWVPAPVRRALWAVNSRLDRLDPVGIEADLKLLEEHVDAEFVKQAEHIGALLGRVEDLPDWADPRVREKLRNRVRDAREQHWTDAEAATQMREAADKYLNEAARLATPDTAAKLWNGLLKRLNSDEWAKPESLAFPAPAEETSTIAAAELGARDSGAPATGPAARPAAARGLSPWQRFNSFRRMTISAGFLGAQLATFALVAVSGLILLYLPNDTFGEGGLKDWVSLAAWGFVTQAGGVSILALVGKTKAEGDSAALAGATGN